MKATGLGIDRGADRQNGKHFSVLGRAGSRKKYVRGARTEVRGHWI